MLKVLNIILQAVVVHGEEILSGGKLRSILVKVWNMLVNSVEKSFQALCYQLVSTDNSEINGLYLVSLGPLKGYAAS